MLVDVDQPVAVLVVSVLHFIPDADDPAGILARLNGPLAAGSHLVLSHGTGEGPRDETVVTQAYRRASVGLTLRSRERVEALLAGWELVEPGVTWVPQWRPETPSTDAFIDEPERSAVYAAVGRKP